MLGQSHLLSMLNDWMIITYEYSMNGFWLVHKPWASRIEASAFTQVTWWDIKTAHNRQLGHDIHLRPCHLIFLRFAPQSCMYVCMLMHLTFYSLCHIRIIFWLISRLKRGLVTHQIFSYIFESIQANMFDPRSASHFAVVLSRSHRYISLYRWWFEGVNGWKTCFCLSCLFLIAPQKQLNSCGDQDWDYR